MVAVLPRTVVLLAPEADPDGDPEVEVEASPPALVLVTAELLVEDVD